MRIGTLDLARQLAKFLQVRGEQPELALSQDIIPIVNAITLDDSPWHGKRGFTYGGTIAAVAGQYARIRVWLPGTAGPAARMVLRYANAYGQAVGRFRLAFLQDMALVGALADLEPLEWDMTLGGREAIVIAEQGASAVAPTNQVLNEVVPAAYSPVPMIGPYIFGAGQGFELVATDPNVGMYYNFQGDIYSL